MSWGCESVSKRCFCRPFDPSNPKGETDPCHEGCACPPLHVCYRECFTQNDQNKIAQGLGQCDDAQLAKWVKVIEDYTTKTGVGAKVWMVSKCLPLQPKRPTGA